MSTLYIANPTRQNTTFFYRLDYIAPGVMVPDRMRLAKQEDIAAGRQTSLGGKNDLMTPQITDIIGQLERYGAVRASELNSRMGYIPYLYEIDRPVPQKVIEQVVHHNSGVKKIEGQDTRKKAALAGNDMLLNKIIDAAAQNDAPMPDDLPDFSIEVEQQENETDQPSLAEGIRVETPRRGRPPNPK